ncbi:bifunctional UDP-N-acetylmuramoyl-tripeptide:D-alanyl-D-alanine ligase/alanine racemase [Pedobacter sp. MC2016-14]|uniref:bifunctional UDP-N-acetylmuramoyl-tripeptide:D-alanyl-D-alanine ligase/alanine racemase n=1 Tax=Pedobacter sp. MC2016-14 TaxID=2897327 RepID=UPI001E4C5345|nr:bifunctional UDP-N-acetylmuramoyl-tripeptide:D-alanyl-D-alanine ligase/alanine racemase [Pedobacter sp. MC2016-14]MCD0488839.1 bifunctional UDP-N-acetylmuramoyl-tripeptide:D-alanyl-D-alanine ligase/alanine racemase [Pedobacter sp. MC2016-14]
MSSTNYSIQLIAEIIKAKDFTAQQPSEITSLVIDSRRVADPEGSLFFALMAQRNGHGFLADAYANGIRNFVISEPDYFKIYPDANFLLVDDVLKSLQQLAAFKRSRHSLPVIGITGSNGKTVVKEWLYQLLAVDFNIIRSPKSFNSQIGVPLSVWQIEPEHTLGIFEAGISTVSEMEALEGIIQPTIGILTNIGEAHAEGFSSSLEKLQEKLKLFLHSDLFIYAPEYTLGIVENDLPGKTRFSWSMQHPADLQVLFIEPIEHKSYIRANFRGKEIECLIPFSDRASVENGVICWATLLALGYTPEEADLRLETLALVSMRLELKTGINQCSVIDDSYSADISSLAIALDFLNQQNQHLQKTVILSDLYETGKSRQVLYGEIAALLKQKNIGRLIGIGPEISACASLFEMETSFYQDTPDFINDFPTQHFSNETILVKGARRFEFSRISKLLTQKIHDTVMEIDLNALAGNLHFYKARLKPGVKVMAMVKAFSYGSGSFEIANLLQYHKVDYLAVAYADEGIALRKAGITMPIMVMSPEPFAFEAIVKYKLEPELYNPEILTAFAGFLPASTIGYPVHLKIDTGMHRLGFEEPDLPELLSVLTASRQLKVISAFSHFAASEDERHDEFTKIQINRFIEISNKISLGLGYAFMRHISNTSAITRHPDAQFDMVRIGIGLYGFDAGLKGNRGLHTVAVLKTTVTQVKQVSAQETIGYGRRGLLPQGGQIATVKIGYADGYRRSFGNGIGKMLVNGKPAATVGSIAMDMCMLDVTGMEVKTGDEVVVFNDVLTIAMLASQIDTIPYEILTNISQRVKRVYFYE